MKNLIISFFIFNAHAAELPKPDLKTLITVLLAEKSKSEADGVSRFVLENKINLDQPVPLTVKRKSVWLSGREIKFSSDNKTFVFNGVNFKTDSNKAFDRAVADAYQRLRPSHSYFSIFIPDAVAETTDAIHAIILGWASSAPATPSFWLNAKNNLTHAVGVALASTLVTSEPPEQTPIKIISASCDKNGMRVETSDHKIAEGKLMVDGKVHFNVIGGKPKGAPTKPAEGSIPAQIEKTGAAIVAQCTSNPIAPEVFRLALQNSLNKTFHNSAVAEIKNPSSSSTP